MSYKGTTDSALRSNFTASRQARIYLPRSRNAPELLIGLKGLPQLLHFTVIGDGLVEKGFPAVVQGSILLCLLQPCS